LNPWENEPRVRRRHSLNRPIFNIRILGLYIIR
jgi:hypothetical protein